LFGEHAVLTAAQRVRVVVVGEIAGQPRRKERRRDAIADRTAGHGRADLDDLAGAVGDGHDGRLALARALDDVEIAKVERDGADTDADIGRTERGRGALHQGQHIEALAGLELVGTYRVSHAAI